MVEIPAEAKGAFPVLRVSQPGTGSVFGAFDAAQPSILVAENGACPPLHLETH